MKIYKLEKQRKVCKLWQEDGKGKQQHDPPSSVTPQLAHRSVAGTNSNNNNDNYMKTSRHFFSRVFWIQDSLYFNIYSIVKHTFIGNLKNSDFKGTVILKRNSDFCHLW